MKANIVPLLVFTALLAAGQVLFKQVGLTMRGHTVTAAFITATRSPALYAALAIYGISTLLWIWILSRVSLSQAYPWIAVGNIIVPLLAWAVFGERVGAAYWLGIALVLCGVFLTQYASPR